MKEETVLIDHDIALLLEVMREHDDVLSPNSAAALSAAVDELTDPLNPPTLMAIDGDVIHDLPCVLRRVRSRLVEATASAPDIPSTLRLGRAARELSRALVALNEPVE